jgi:hypothetical protein
MKINLMDIMESLTSDNVEDAQAALHEWFVEQGKQVHARMTGQVQEADWTKPEAYADGSDADVDADADADADLPGDEETPDTMDDDDIIPETPWDNALDTIDDDGFEISDMIGDEMLAGQQAGTANVDWMRTGFQANVMWVAVDQPEIESSHIESLICAQHATADFNKACFWGMHTEVDDEENEFYAVWVAFNATMKQDEAFYEKQLSYHVDNMAIVARIRELSGTSAGTSMESVVSEEEGTSLFDVRVSLETKTDYTRPGDYQLVNASKVFRATSEAEASQKAIEEINSARLSKSFFDLGEIESELQWHVTSSKLVTKGPLSATVVSVEPFEDTHGDYTNVSEVEETYEDLVAELAESFNGLETVSDRLQNVEGAQVGEEGKVPVNKKSTLPSKKGAARVGGSAVEIKSKDHKGHALEKAPKVKDAPVKHHVQNSKDDPKKVSASKSALLNKMDGSVNTQSPISGKGAKGLKK